MVNMSFLIVLILICVACDLIAKSIKQRDSSLNEEDARTLQELHKVATRMEDRVEALETILIERSRDDEFARKL